jgi:hypothetical protein
MYLKQNSETDYGTLQQAFLDKWGSFLRPSANSEDGKAYTLARSERELPLERLFYLEDALWAMRSMEEWMMESENLVQARTLVGTEIKSFYIDWIRLIAELPLERWGKEYWEKEQSMQRFDELIVYMLQWADTEERADKLLASFWFNTSEHWALNAHFLGLICREKRIDWRWKRRAEKIFWELYVEHVRTREEREGTVEKYLDVLDETLVHYHLVKERYDRNFLRQQLEDVFQAEAFSARNFSYIRLARLCEVFACGPELMGRKDDVMMLRLLRQAYPDLLEEKGRLEERMESSRNLVCHLLQLLRGDLVIDETIGEEACVTRAELEEMCGRI